MDKAKTLIGATTGDALDLSGLNLDLLPDELFELAQLTDLNISKNNITSIPLGISKLTNLKKLTAQGCSKLTSIHNQISNLKQLEELDINSCAFTELPPQVSGLVALKTFTFGPQSVPTFDISSLVSVASLRTLNLSGIKVPGLPYNFDLLKQIEHLNIANMGFSEFPPPLLNMTQLKTLDASGNSLKGLVSLHQFQALETLKLDGLADKTLPHDIGHLTKLTSLSVANSSLESLPLSLCQVPLKSLNLSGCSSLKLIGDLSPSSFDGQSDPKSLLKAMKIQALKEGHVRLIVVGGKDLAAMDPNGKSDPYCFVEFNNEKFKSPKHNKTLNPTWNFAVALPKGTEPLDVVFNVFDHDTIGSDDFLGTASLNIEFATLPQKYELKFEERQGKKDKVSGSISVIVTI